MTTRHHEKYKDKYLHLKRRMCRMRGGDEAIQKLLKDQLGRLQLLSPDPDEDGDALRVLQTGRKPLLLFVSSLFPRCKKSTCGRLSPTHSFRRTLMMLLLLAGKEDGRGG